MSLSTTMELLPTPPPSPPAPPPSGQLGIATMRSNITSLPIEILEVILLDVVKSIGPIQAVHLRTLNKTFNIEVEKAIFTKGVLDYAKLKHNTFLRSPLGSIFTAKWLSSQADRYVPVLSDRYFEKASGRSLLMKSRLLETIRRSVEFCTVGKSEEEKREKTYILCQLAVICMEDRPWKKVYIETGCHSTDYEFEVDFRKSDIFAAAACLGELELLMQMIEEGPFSAGEETEYFGTAISAAAWQGHTDVVRFLYDMGFEYDYEGYSMSPLGAAARGAQDDLVRVLLVEYDAPILSFDFGFAARGGHVRTVQNLIDFASSIKTVDSRVPDVPAQWALENILTEACCNGPSHMAEMVIQGLCGHLLAPDPLFLVMASQYGQRRTVKLLLKNGANPDPRTLPGVARNRFYYDYGYMPSPLLVAVQGGHSDIVKILLESGADPNYGGEAWDESTPLVEAVLLGSHEIVKTLLESGANPDYGAGEWKASRPLLEAVKLGSHGIVKTLLESGANPDYGAGEWKYGKASRPLLEAVKLGSHEIVKTLLESGASFKTHGKPYRMSFFHQILEAIVSRDDLPMMRLLCETALSYPLSQDLQREYINKALQRGKTEMAGMIMELNQVSFDSLYFQE